MSSDEDELLDNALKEQAQRSGASYQKPSTRSSKPVVNLVQPPPPPRRNADANAGSGSRAGTKVNQAKARNPSRDYDEDSEVELLSISSGEEDSVPRERAPPPPARARGAPSDRRAYSRDDSEFDGPDDGEPRSWKKVDEAELARRVREMRETRAAPIQVIDQKATAIARKGLATMQSLPRGVEVLDPLGLGVIDNKSLRLITDASVSSPVSREKAEALDPVTREKIIYSSPHFDPKVFLSWVHRDTSAADLEAGALTLRTALKGRTQQKRQLVKENFDCFISCKNTIDDIQSKLRQIEDDPEGSGTAHLHDVTQNINKIANNAFQPLFERQAQAEKIRSVQGMLQRFRTLFNLPSAIRGNIKKGEYDVAVREYRKAKSIVLPSHVGILKRVLEEVEKVMQEFRGMLYKSMEDPNLELTELENIVRLLLELEPDSDPIWHYLNIQNRRIRGLFERCTLEHEARMEVLQSQIHEKVQSDARWRQLQRASNRSDVHSPVGDFVQSEAQEETLMSEEADTLRTCYIHMLIAILVQHIPSFWRLALSVFGGKFAKAAAGNAIIDADVNSKSVVNKNDDKVSEAKYTNHTLEEVATMVRATISTFEAKVLSTFRNFEEANILSPYMSDVIQEISKACQSLEVKDSSPSIAVKALHALRLELTKLCILRLCSWMRTSTKDITKNEIWVILSTLERNKSPYAISSMPLEFRRLTISVMDKIDGLVQNLKIELSKLYDVSEQLHEIQESIRLAFLNSFLDFAGYLEQFVVDLAQRRSNKDTSDFQNGYLHDSGEYSNQAESHRRLLVVLSNIGFCKVELSSELYKKYKHIWLPYRDNDERTADLRDLMASFSALEEKVLEQYILAKSNMIRDAVLNYLLDSGIQWGSAPTVKGIRVATVELLHILVSVHAEVCIGARPFLEKMIGILVGGLVDTFLSLFHENSSKYLKALDGNGFCQLMLELDYFETILHSYFTPDTHEAFKSLQGYLLEKACESVSEIPENAGHNRRATRGSEDALADEKQQAVSPDDLLALAQQCSHDLLQLELDRTRLNIVCFLPSSLQPDPPLSARPTSSSTYNSSGSTASPSFRKQSTSVNSPVASRRRR